MLFRSLTVIYQIDAHCRRLLWVGRRRSQATLRRGLKALGPEVVKGLRFVCSDMWKPYLKVNGEEPIMRRKAAGPLSLLGAGRNYLVIIRPSERVEPRHQLHVAFPAWRLGGSGSPIHFFQSFAFGFNTGSRVDIGCVETFMSKPAANHRHVDLCCHETHGCGVPEPVWGDSLAEQ